MKALSKNLLFTILIILIFSLISLLFFRNLTNKKAPENTNVQDHLILGFSQIGSESAWRTRNTESIFEAAEENNIQIIFDDAQQKQENQLKAIRSFIVYQVDVIAFVPIVEDGWDNVLQEAKDAGIPVIIVDRQINTDQSLYAGFLGEDGFQEGMSAANFLVNKCKTMPDETINIVEFSGTVHSSVATGRSKGFMTGIEKDKRLKIIHSEDGDFLRSRGKEIMEKILSENGGKLFIGGEKIHVIYSHNDEMTLGLLDTMNDAGISPKSVIIISIDAEQKSIDELVNHNLNCVVECNPNLGPILMKLVKDIAQGKSIPRITYMNETVFNENDDFSTYKPRGY